MLVLCLTGLGAHAPLNIWFQKSFVKAAHRRQLSCLYGRSAYSMLCDRVIEYSAHIMSNSSPDPSNSVIQVSDMENALHYCYSMHSEKSEVRVTCGWN